MNMPAPGSRRLPLPSSPGLLLAATLALAACGSNHGINTGSSSGGSNAVLAGTYTKAGASTRHNDSAHIFGAVNSVGNGWFADLAGSSRAVFVFGSASSNGTLDGTFAAYAANGSNLGDGTTLQSGTLGGSVANQSGTTSASVTYSNSAFSNAATLVLDQPPLGQTALAGAAGTFSVSLGNTAIASTALFNLGGNSYSLSLASGGSASLTTVSGCTFNGTATPDSAFDVYDLHLGGTCSGTTLTLDGQALYLPAGSASPLDGSPLAKATLLVELSDFLVNGSSPQYALVLIAPKSS
jgi:hypothetical protein